MTNENERRDSKGDCEERPQHQQRARFKDRHDQCKKCGGGSIYRSPVCHDAMSVGADKRARLEGLRSRERQEEEKKSPLAVCLRTLTNSVTGEGLINNVVIGFRISGIYRMCTIH